MSSSVATNAGKPLRFNVGDAFYKDLKQRVERYFRFTGQRQRDCWQMYVKSAVIFAWFVASYIGLVFFAFHWGLGIALACSLGLAMAAIGFNIQHDGGHKAYSNRNWINKLSAMSLDLLGGSSFLWDHKHNTIHHTYANIHNHDDDINVGFLGRLAPEQPRRKFHRLQHFYLWPLYGLISIKWQLFDDFYNVAVGRIGEHKFSRPKGWNLAIFIGGKVAFLTIAFVIPMFFHAWWLVLLFYAFTSILQGVVLAIVFQLAHVVEDAQFPVPDPETNIMPSHWAVHQVQTTVDFARRNPVLTWFLGGLNFQIEHHLFPRISHIHYPKLSRIVERTCKRFDIAYNCHQSFMAGVVSHYRWLRQMGMPTT